jgi:hypothetical protein
MGCIHYGVYITVLNCLWICLATFSYFLVYPVVAGDEHDVLL